MTRHLVQILLPTHTRDGTPVANERFARVRLELTERFGGATAYSRSSPATGLWKRDADEVIEHDRVIMVEVVVNAFDRDWWVAYRKQLETHFEQEEVHMRALAMELI